MGSWRQHVLGFDFCMLSIYRRTPMHHLLLNLLVFFVQALGSQCVTLHPDVKFNDASEALLLKCTECSFSVGERLDPLLIFLSGWRTTREQANIVPLHGVCFVIGFFGNIAIPANFYTFNSSFIQASPNHQDRCIAPSAAPSQLLFCTSSFAARNSSEQSRLGVRSFKLLSQVVSWPRY